MGALHEYLTEEVAIDHADGIIGRREALRRLGLLGLGAAAAGTLLAACAREEDDVTATPTGAAPTAASKPESVLTEAITFPGPDGRTLRGAWAEAESARGGVLVIHENRGLTDHIRDVAGRFAAAGYTALAVDLLSEEGGTESLKGEAEAMAALDKAPDERFVADMKAAVTELEKRLEDKKLGAVGFCFGGAMVWQLLASGEPRLAAAAPFYGPAPENPDFTGSEAAVLGVYAGQDSRVNASRDAARTALEEAELDHEIVTFPGVDHAFFNDTGMRYDAEQADRAWERVLDWFETHLD